MYRRELETRVDRVWVAIALAMMAFWIVLVTAQVALGSTYTVPQNLITQATTWAQQTAKRGVDNNWAQWLLAVGVDLGQTTHKRTQEECDAGRQVWAGWNLYCDALEDYLAAIPPAVVDQDEEEVNPPQDDPPPRLPAQKTQVAVTEWPIRIQYNGASQDARLEFQEGENFDIDFRVRLLTEVDLGRAVGWLCFDGLDMLFEHENFRVHSSADFFADTTGVLPPDTYCLGASAWWSTGGRRIHNGVQMKVWFADVNLRGTTLDNNHLDQDFTTTIRIHPDAQLHEAQWRWTDAESSAITVEFWEDDYAYITPYVNDRYMLWLGGEAAEGAVALRYYRTVEPEGITLRVTHTGPGWATQVRNTGRTVAILRPVDGHWVAGIPAVSAVTMRDHLDCSRGAAWVDLDIDTVPAGVEESNIMLVKDSLQVCH